jgi:ATP-binding cassette subfamily B protein
VLEKVRAAGTRFAAARRQANAELFGFLEERLAGIVDLQANGAAGNAMARLRDRVAEVFHASRTAFLMGSVLGAAAGSVFMLGTVGALALGAYLYGVGALTLGAVYVVLQYTGMIRQNLGEIQRQARDFQAAEASIKRVRELAALRPTVQDGVRELPDGALSVELRRVSFRYAEAAPLALDGASLRLAPGKVLGLLGRTGAGKSTLARLLARLYDPREGAVLLGGVDLREARLDGLRRRVGVVSQEVQLFRASLKENITLFDGTVSDERALAALDELGLDAWARARGGLEAELDPGGLSAGEAQLLQLSRVLLKDPGLVVLDEASSRLDPATERLLERAVERLLAGRTAIVIAHRLRTVERADEVLILERGRVVEHGPRADLAADPRSRFAELLAVGLERELVGGAA